MQNQFWAQIIEQDEEWDPVCVMTSTFESAGEAMVQEFIEATSGEIKFGVVRVWEFDGEHPVTKIFSWEADFSMPEDMGDLEEGDEFEVDGTIQMTEREG